MVGENIDQDLASLLYLSSNYKRPSHQVLHPVYNQFVQSLFDLRFFIIGIALLALMCQLTEMSKQQDKSWCTRGMGTLFLLTDVYSQWLYTVIVSAQHLCVNSMLHGLTRDSWPMAGFNRSQLESLATCSDSTIPNSGATSRKRAWTHSAEAPSERASLSEILEQKPMSARVTSGSSDYKSRNTAEHHRLESGSSALTCTGSGMVNSALSPGLWSVQSTQKPVHILKLTTQKKVQRDGMTRSPTSTSRKDGEARSILNMDDADPSLVSADRSQSAQATRLAEPSFSANKCRDSPRGRKVCASPDQEEKSPLVDVVGCEHNHLASYSSSVPLRSALSVRLAAEACDETDSWSTNDDEVGNFLAARTPRHLTPFQSSALWCPISFSPERATAEAKQCGNNSVTQTLWEAFEKKLAKIEWKENDHPNTMLESHCSSTDFQTKEIIKPKNLSTSPQQYSVHNHTGIRNISHPSIELSLDEPRDRLQRKTPVVRKVSQLKTSSFLVERSDITYSVATNDKLREAGVGPGSLVNKANDTSETDSQESWPDGSENNLSFKAVAGSKQEKQTGTNKEKKHEGDYYNFSLVSSGEQEINPEEIHMVESLSKMEEILEDVKCSDYAQSTSSSSISEQSVLAVRVGKPTTCTRSLFNPRNRQRMVTNSRDNIIDVGANASLLSACSQKLYSKAEAKPHKWVVYPEKVSQTVISVTDAAQTSPPSVCSKVVGTTFSSDGLRKTSPRQDERLIEEKTKARHYKEKDQENILASTTAPASKSRKRQTKRKKHQNENVEETSKKRKRSMSGRQTGIQQGTKQVSTSISQEWANIKEQFKSIYKSTNVEKGDFHKKKTEAPLRVSSPAASLESQFGPSTALENILLNKNPLRGTILLCKSGFVTTYEDYQRVKAQGPGLVRSNKKESRSKRTLSLMRFLEQIEKDEVVTKDSREDPYSAAVEERTEMRRCNFPQMKGEIDATGLKRSEREKPALPEKREACRKDVSLTSLAAQPPLIFQDRKLPESSGNNETRKENSMSYSCIPVSKQTRKTKVKHPVQQSLKKQSMIEKKSDMEGHGDSLVDGRLNQNFEESQTIQTLGSQSRHGHIKRLTSKIPIPKKEKGTVIRKTIKADFVSQPSTLAENKEILAKSSSSLLDAFLNLNLSPKSTSISRCSLPHVGSNTIFELSTSKPFSGSKAHSTQLLSLSPPADELALKKYLASTVSKVTSAPVASLLALSASPNKRERVRGVEVKRASRRSTEMYASATTQKQPAMAKTPSKTASVLNRSESRSNRAHNSSCEAPQSHTGRSESVHKSEGRVKKAVEQHEETEFSNLKLQPPPEETIPTGVTLTQEIENTKQETRCNKKQTLKELNTVDTLSEAVFATKKENQIPEGRVKQVTEIKKNVSQLQLMLNSSHCRKTSPVKAKSLPSIYKQAKIKQSKMAQEDKNLSLSQDKIEDNQADTSQAKQDSDAELALTIPNSSSQLGCALISHEAGRPASTTRLDDPRIVISGHSASSLKLNANRVSFSMDNVCQGTRGKLTWRGTLTFRKRAQRFNQTRLMSKKDSGVDFKSPSVSNRQSPSISSLRKVQPGQSEPRLQTKKKELFSSSGAWAKKKPFSFAQTGSSITKSRVRKESCQVRKHETSNVKTELAVRGAARKKLDSGKTTSGTQLKTENPPAPSVKPNRDTTVTDATGGNLTTASKGDENPRALVTNKHPNRQQEHVNEIRSNRKTVAPRPLTLTKTVAKKTVSTVANRTKPMVGTRKNNVLGSRVSSKIAAAKPVTNPREKLLNNLSQVEAASRANNYKQAPLLFPEANNHDVVNGTATSSLRIPSRVDVTKDELQDLLNKVKLDSKLTTQKSNTGLSGKFSSKRKGIISGDKMSRSWSEARLARPPRYLKKNTPQRNAALCVLNATKVAQNQIIKSSSKERKALTEVHKKSSTREKIMNNGQAVLDRDEKTERTVNESGTDSVSFSNNVVEVSEQPPTTCNEEASQISNLNTYSLTSSALQEQRPGAMTRKAEDSQKKKSPPSQLQPDFRRNEIDVHVVHDQALTLSYSLQQNKGKASENENLPSTEEPTKTDADSGICTAENSQQKLTSSGNECRSQVGGCRPEHLDILSLAITDSMEQSLSSDITIINRLNGMASSKADSGSFKQKQISQRSGDNDAVAEIAVQPVGKFVSEAFNESISRRLQTQNSVHAKQNVASYETRGVADARNEQTTDGDDVVASSSTRKVHNRLQCDFVFNTDDSKTANRQNDDTHSAIDVKHSSSSISNSMLLQSHRQESFFTNIKDTTHSEGLVEATTSSLCLSPSQCNLATCEAVLINVISDGRIKQMKTLRPVLAPSENCTTSFDVHAVPGVAGCKSSLSVELETIEPRNAPLSQQNQSVFVLGVPESPASNQSFLMEPLASEDTLVSVNMEQEAHGSMLPRKVERSPEMLNLLEPPNRNLERNWDRWEDEFYFSPAKDSVDSQHCSNDFYLEQVDTTGVQIPRVQDRKDKMPIPCSEMDVQRKGDYALKLSSPNSTSKNALDGRRDSKLREKSPFRTEGSVSLVDNSTKKGKGSPESETTIMNISQPPDKNPVNEPDRNDCFLNSFPFSRKQELGAKTERNHTAHYFEANAGNNYEKVQDGAIKELRKNHKPRDPSLEKEKQHPSKETKDTISTSKKLFEFPAGKEQANKQKNKPTRFSPIDGDSGMTSTGQNHAPKIDRAKSRSPNTEKRPVEANEPNKIATIENSPELEVCKKSSTKQQQLSVSAFQSAGVPKRKREKTRSKVKTLRDLLWSPVGEELKQRLREEAMTSEKLPTKSRAYNSDTSVSLGKQPQSGISEAATKKADIKPLKDEPAQNVGKANVGFEDKPKLTLKDKIEDLEMLLNSEINKYKASRGRGKEATQLFGTGTSFSESCSRKSKKSDAAACDRSSRTKSRMSSTSDRHFNDVREKPQSENDSLKGESNNRKDNSPLSQTAQKCEGNKLSKRPGKFRRLYTRLDDFIRFSEGTGACPMPVKKTEADDMSSITYLTPTSEEDERLNTILKQTSSNFSMSKRRRADSRSKKTVTSREEAPAAGATVKKENDSPLNDSCRGYTGTPEPASKATPPTQPNNKSFSKTLHQPKDTSLSHQLDELPHARSRSNQVEDWSPEVKSVPDAENMDISSASSSDIVLSWVGSCSNLDEDVTTSIPPQPCNKDLTKDVIGKVQAGSPASRKSTSQTHWVKNKKEFSKVWEEDRDRFHRWRVGVNTKDHLSVAEEMVFKEVDNEREYYDDQTAPAGDNRERTGPVFDGFLQTYIGSDINNFLYQSSELNPKQELHVQDASVEPFNFPNYQGNRDSPRINRASNQKGEMHAYTPSPRSPSHSTSLSDGQDHEVGMTTNQYFKNACSSSQNPADKPRSPERRRRARRSRHYDKTVTNDPKSTKERERDSVLRRRHTFRVDTPDRLIDLSHTDQEKGRYVQSAWEYQKIRSVPKELSPQPEQNQILSGSTRDDGPFLRHDQKTEKDGTINSPYSRDQFVSILYHARRQHDLSPNFVKNSDCLAIGERRDSGDSLRREEAVLGEKCEGGRHWHSSETLTSGVSPGKRVRRKDRGANIEPSEQQSCFGKPQHRAASPNGSDSSNVKNKLSLHQHLSTKPTTDENAVTNDNSNSSRASVNWYRPQSLSSSTSVQNGPTGGASASGTVAAASTTPLTERPTHEGVSISASLGVNQGTGGPGRLSLDTPVRVSLGSPTASRTAPRRQLFSEVGRKSVKPSVGKIVQMFEQKMHQ